MVRAAGLESVVAPKLITVNRILRLVRGLQDKSGNVMTALYRITDAGTEAAEFLLTENTPNLGVPLKDLTIRKGGLKKRIQKERVPLSALEKLLATPENP